MSEQIIYNQLLFGFKASDSRIVIYLKHSEEHMAYAVKVMHSDGTKTTVLTSQSLSTAMREFAETIAQFTGDFTTWSKLA